MTATRRTPWPAPRVWLITLLFACALPLRAWGAEENRLRRIEIVPHQGYSRINLFFAAPPDYSMSILPGELRITVQGADSPSFRKWRDVSDSRISGVFCARRGGTLRVVVPLKPGTQGVQAVSCANPALLSLDIGPAVQRRAVVDIAPGREPILSGVEQFVREFGVPSRAGLPFVPTDAKLLVSLLSEEDVRLFRQGEGHLYREQGNEAAAVFKTFLGPERSVGAQALARYRLGEALHLLEQTDEALAAFRQGEALWPGYLEQAPKLMQSYAEVRAQTGDYRGARLLLARLMEKAAGTGYLPQLVNLLAELTERHGAREAALALYRSVAQNAPGTTAAARAAMKIADREMFTLSRDRYPLLLRRYRSLYEAPGEFALRDEALFKMALLQALYARAPQALAAVTSYDRRYPRGIFSMVAKNMREELLLTVYRESSGGKGAGLARLALEHRDYLARCFSDPAFAPRLARSFREGGLLTRELELFLQLAERLYAAPAAPFLMARVVEDALFLGRLEVAESAGRRFLDRFPADPGAQRVREQLGRIAFERKELPEVTTLLGFLNLPGHKAAFPESDYYLGKALVASGDQKGAEASLTRFVTSVPAGSSFISDGYFSLGGARSALGKHAGALAAYEIGARLAPGEQADRFLYKMGELYLSLGLVRQATGAWEQVAGRTGGGTWKKHALEALADVRWRLKIARELP